ncbi:uncharacterized protein LOC113513645 [Galleria mellonella]|uniref:Uncharacterized protein LOC113513645 n=1 Tax=Galleria mellonella TaxID=7137 RepID=A0ABM3MSS2_GALME|nr:uncharacterized protein LOC113513645 [Galleria mellonella]XP_052754207.1 uncharacterized protein LOC113513645 [Galleria mellonella]XP_052754208.1 uncharacterized protein LOC113513645 [Galleria mellonella]
MRTTQVVQYALRLTYSQRKRAADVRRSKMVVYQEIGPGKKSTSYVPEQKLRQVNRDKIMNRSAVALAAIGFGLSTFSIRQMIINHSRRM